MKTVVVDTRADMRKAVAAAVETLKAKDVVALPTETVYGLAGDALELEAVSKIFEAKERPTFDPLIIHLACKEWLARLTCPSDDTKPLLEKLMARFWPGPLTMLFPKTDM